MRERIGEEGKPRLSLAPVLMGVAILISTLSTEALAATVGTTKAPSALVEVAPPELRTPEMMKAAESQLGAIQKRDIPFRPTISPSAYEAEKHETQLTRRSPISKLDALRALGQPMPAAAPLAPPTKAVLLYGGSTQRGGGGSYPPDTHGAVGLTQFVQVVNSLITVRKKSDNSVQLSASLGAFFGSSQFLFDPRAVYDSTWNRWVVVATRFPISGANPQFFLAVSTSSDATGSWYIYLPTYSGGGLALGDFFDYPQLGMDQDAIFVTSNIFTASDAFKFAAMTPIAKARVYNGLSFFVPIFTSLAATLAPPVVLDQDARSYFVAANTSPNLALYRGENLSNPSQATLTLQGNVAVGAYSAPPNARQPGTTQLLDSLDGRFLNASTQMGSSLWNVHTIALGTFPAPKFYQINTANTSLVQSGFFFESVTSDDWNASIAVNSQGEAFVTWNSTDVLGTGTQHQARIRYSGRQPSDPLGSIPAGSTLSNSSVALVGNAESSTVQRWGDYSAVSIDPQSYTGCAAGRRFWLSNERIQDANTWGSRIGRAGFC